MNENAHAHSHTQNSAPDSQAAPQLKRCTSCLANLTVAHFGLAKYGSSGRSAICHQCRAQYLRLKRQEKYGAKSNIDDSHIRIVALHNKAILGHALPTNKLEFRAFDVVSMAEYHVFYGPSDRLGLQSLTLFTKDGSVFMEWALSGVKEPVQFLLAYLRLHSLRLELSDMDLLNSKRVIYFL
jgi:hypothetical protein